MELNEVKKVLYKENPKAVFVNIVDGKVYYETKIKEGVSCFHIIPVEETKGTTFNPEMDSKFLIRWLTEGLRIEV